MKKEKGKMKSEKVPVLRSLGVGGWKPLLFALSLLFFTFCSFAAVPGPQLVPDYDRDGEIGAADREKAFTGDEFTIWLNDDDDAEGTEGGAEAGDTNTDLHDVPGGNDRKDCADGEGN